MRRLIFLIFLSFILQVHAENNLEELIPENITIDVVSPEDKTLCQIYGNWKLSFEITNTNPYTVFVAIPEAIECYNKSLKYYKDFKKVNVSGVVATYVDRDMVVVNGERGIWVPPYTTVKVYRHGIFIYNIGTTVMPNKFKVIGPVLVNTTWVIDDFLLENYIYKYGVKIGNYRLVVHGKIVKKPDTDVLSMVIPAPLVLKNYDRFHKLLGRHDVDIWVNSYNDYIEKHHKLYDERREIAVLEKGSELHNLMSSPFIPSVDDALIPERNRDFVDKDLNLRPFDVPAMVFTTDDGDMKALEFAYVMYKY